MQCQVTTKNVRIFYIGSGKIAGTNSGCIIGAESCIVMSSVTRPNQWNKGGGGGREGVFRETVVLRRWGI